MNVVSMLKFCHGDVYQAEIIGQELRPLGSKLRVNLRVRLTRQVGSSQGPSTTPGRGVGEEVTTGITLDPDDEYGLKCAAHGLEAVGFKGSDIELLDLEHPEKVSLVGQTITVLRNGSYWNIQWNKPKGRTSDVRALCNKIATKLAVVKFVMVCPPALLKGDGCQHDGPAFGC